MGTLNELITKLGSCSPSQAALLFAIHTIIAWTVWARMLMAFGNFDPGWQCLDQDALAMKKSGADAVWKARNNSISQAGPSVFNTTGKNAEAFFPRVHSLRNQSSDQCEDFPPCRNVSFLPGSSTVVSEWVLLCGLKWVPSFMFTVQSVGMMAGSYVTEHLGDCVGLKTKLSCMVGLYALLHLGIVLTPAWQVFTCVRLLIGLSVGGIITYTNAISAQFMGPVERAVSSNLPTWSFSFVLFSTAVFVLRDWRQIHICIAVLAISSFLLAIYVPMGPHWRAAQGKGERAARVARRKMKERPPLSTKLLVSAADTERKLDQKKTVRSYCYVDLLCRGGKRVRKHALFMGIFWFCMSFIYFGISFSVQSLSGDFYVNFLTFAVAEIPALLCIAPILKYFGRRWATTIHLLIGALASFAIVPASFLLSDIGTVANLKDLSRGAIIMCLTLTVKLMALNAWTVVTPYSAEIFSGVFRKQAVHFTVGLSRIGAILGVWVIPQQPIKLEFIFTGVGVFMMLSAALMLRLPETGVPHVEDIVKRPGSNVQPPSDRTAECNLNKDEEPIKKYDIGSVIEANVHTDGNVDRVVDVYFFSK